MSLSHNVGHKDHLYLDSGELESCETETGSQINAGGYFHKHLSRNLRTIVCVQRAHFDGIFK